MNSRPKDSIEEFSLSEGFIGGFVVSIEKEQFARGSKALATLKSAWDIEESFQVFVQSFIRFEKDMLDIALEFAFPGIEHRDDEELLNSYRHRFNVNIMTVLTSLRSYDDISNAAVFPDDKGTLKSFNQKNRQKIYDQYLSYRICYKLRDYAQHKALPLGGFSAGGVANLGRDDEGRYVKLDTGYNVFPWLSLTKFRASSQCKAELRRELEHLGFEKMDIRWLLRSLTSAMYQRHSAVRDFIRPHAENSGQEIVKLYDLVSDQKGSAAQFLEINSKHSSEDMRIDLASNLLSAFKTYTSLMNAEFSYVTSQIKPDKNIYSGKGQ